MTAIDTGASSVPEVPASTGASVRAMALGLWVVVGSLLAYGVLQTAIKAAALFG
jgi:hypothetical protein